MPPAIDLARRYAEALAALRAVHRFDEWLGRHWHDRCSAATTPAASHTSLGASGTIAWHEDEESVVGYLPGEAGCFRISRAAMMPDFSQPGSDLPLVIDQDVLINATMRDEGNRVTG
jgi:hypothetical protein